MPLSDNNPVSDETITLFNPVGGTPGGSRANMPCTVRGQLMQAGFIPNSLITSAITLAVAIGNNQVSSVASTFTQVISSTLGTFSSTNTFEGACCSVVPASPVFVNKGDAIQFTTSGGQTSAVGVTCYAIVRRV